MTGKVKEAKMELQENICNHILELFEEIYKRGMDLVNTFNLKKIRD
jgi:hypothetical protein